MTKTLIASAAAICFAMSAPAFAQDQATQSVALEAPSAAAPQSNPSSAKVDATAQQLAQETLRAVSSKALSLASAKVRALVD